MTKKTEPGMAYNTKKLNKIFAFLSVIFLMSVFWVFLDDYIRPWKAVQIEGMKIKREKLEEKLNKVSEGIDEKKVEELKSDLKIANENLSSKKDDIKAVTIQSEDVAKKIKAETILNGTLNSQVSAWSFKYETAHAKHKPEAPDYYVKMKDYKKRFAESKDRMKALQSKEKELTKQLMSLKAEVIEAEKNIGNLINTRDLLKKAVAQTDMGPIFALRNSPMIDYLDPTLKIQQIVLENITDDRYFQKVPKVDRCITCHMFSDQPGYEDQPNPFKTHPKLDMMVGLDSPHPMKQFGCTTCHGGEGHRVNDFSAPAHTPQNDEQRLAWVEKYNWHAPHKISQPMFKLQNTEASCVKCHKGVEFVPGGTVVNDGIKNIEKFGCYGCHKIEGWEHKRKPGPSLNKITAKISKEFFKNWVWDPKSFNPHANMPRFFEQSNNSEPQFVRKNIAEVNAMAEYIWDKSKKYKPFMKYRGGSADNGKELVKSVGCMGCHGVQDFPEISEKINNNAGPYLYATGTKVKDADWLVSWLKKPRHYQEDTIMPSFRLSDKEANDIAAYLLSLRNKKFEKLKFASLDQEARDEILLDYFTAFDTKAAAEEKLTRMSDRERTLELGYRSIGKYGCYSCHNIDGFEGRAPIGPELTKVGSKPITQFGFGHDHSVEHSRHGWIKAHLLNPRRWDVGVDKPFKDLTRMPNFYMTEEESQSMTVYLLGNVSEFVPLKGIKRLDSDEQIVADGMKVVNKYNCIGCHQIDGVHGNILEMYEDDLNEGPPRLVGEGHRVQVDWFHYFLDNVYPIRPWLKIRMPSYGLSDEERNAVVSMFQHKAKQRTLVDRSKIVNWAPGEREGAKQLFESLACASCHTAGFNNDEPSAPNLYFVRRRLRPSWVKKWLLDPQAILPGTVMPNFWEDGESTDEEVFGGDPQKQIDALTKYMYEIGTEKLPTKNTNYWSKQ